MKNKIIKSFFIIALFSLFVFSQGKAIISVFAAATDITAPVFKSITVSPSTVLAGNNFVVSIAVTDDISGVKKANVVFESPSGQYVLHAEPSYADSAGNWRASVFVPTNSEIGIWKVRSIYLADNAGNDTTLYNGNQINYSFTIAGSTTGTSSSQANTITTCVSFDYSDWSSCQKGGTQSRSILNAYPLDCIGGSPVLSQACTYLYQCNDDRPYLNQMNKDNCTSSRGAWDSTNCICSCPTGWHFEGTGCIYTTAGGTTATSGMTTTTTGTNTTNTTSTTASTCSSFTYSNWSVCGSSGTQTRSVLSSSPSSCTGGNPVLTQSCTYVAPTTGTTSTTTTTTTGCNANRPYLDELNKNNCISSSGTWSANTCICSCPTGWHFEGTGCLYTNVNLENTCSTFTYSDWSECANGKQSRTILKSIPTGCTGGSPEEISRYCIVSTACTEDKWDCGSWSACTNGKQLRTCNLTSDCKEIENKSPVVEQTCVSAATTVKNYCKYTYSDWNTCTNGKQNRSILTRLPTGCTDNNIEALERTCISPTSACEYTYSDWNTCNNGKQSRTVISQYPTNCSGTPILEQDCISTVEQLPNECVQIGWNNKNDCDLYTYREKIIADCKENNLNTQDSCREYMLNKYGKPTKCNNISGVACDNLINNVILSDLTAGITTEVKQQLSDISGMSAVINTRERTITVQGEPVTSGGAVETKEVKVEAMPLASSDSGQVSVSLLPTNSNSSDSGSSPVAITFDSDGDGLPDDVEKRLGTDPFKKDTDGDGIDDGQELKNGTNPLDPLAKTTTIVLTGVDKAMVDGKTLEQPKATTSTVSASLTVNSVETVKQDTKNNLKFQGKAQPNQVITLFIYSTMPIVVTVQADANGNWVYELDKTLIDGTHEAYVAINNDQGKIIEASLPTPFFIAQAQAVSVDNFVATGDASQVPDKTNNMMILYILAGIAVIVVLIAAVLIIRQSYSE